MSKKKEIWEPCPRCESKKVESRGGCFFSLLGFMLIGISIWLLVIPALGITGIVLGIVLIFSSPFMKSILQCQDCKKAWRFPHGTKAKEGV